MANIFSLILTIATLITGIIWVIEQFKISSFRKKKIIQQHNGGNKSLEKIYLDKNMNYPSWINTCSSIFPMLATVLVIRSFVYEPFQIPSGSMMPTLLVGDFILVEKFAYGLKDPLTQTTLLETGKPKRGDVVVFKYPKDSKTNFVKRIIGIPGDKIIYDPEKKELQIYPNYRNLNYGIQILPIIYSALEDSEWTLFFNTNSIEKNNQISSYLIPLNKQVPINALRQKERIETIDGVSHKILVIPQAYTQSHYQQPGLLDNEWIIPPKHYFFMGDNRDNSADSRIWGLVPERNFVGRVVAIWFSLDRHEGKWPTGVRLNRIGKIN